MKKKTLILGLILTAFFLITSTSIQADIPNNHIIEGNSVFIEDTQASLRVTPHTAQFPSANGYKQEFEICNKTGITTNLYGAYVFNYELEKGKVEYLTSEGYGWVEHEKDCFFDFDYETNVNPAPNVHQGECYYINLEEEKVIIFDMSFKTGDIETGNIKYDVNKWVKNWSNVTTSFEKKNINEKSVYAYTSGKEVLANSCETWRITYKPNKNDTTEKWDLWLWADTGGWDCILTDSCQKTLKLDPWWTGEGSEGDPFIIEDCNQLQTMDSYTSLVGTPLVAYFELGNDIDCSEFGNFDPIGYHSGDDYFHGHLDGKDYSISNITIDSEQGGLFSTLRSASLKNVALIDFNVWNSGGSVGASAVSGFCLVGTVIENVYVQGATIGGVGTAYVAGFIGVAYTGCIVKNSYVVDSSVVTNTSTLRVGGFAGAIQTDANIFNCYSNTSVTGGGTDAGAFIGYNSGATCTNCFYDTDTAVEPDNVCGTGKTTLQMFQEATFTNWDFDTIWTIEEDVNYPRLQSFFPPVTDSCSCPPTSHWEIIDGDNCYLASECNLTAGNLHIVEGQLTITSIGTLNIPSNYYVFIQKDNNLHIEKGGKLFITK